LIADIPKQIEKFFEQQQFESFEELIQMARTSESTDADTTQMPISAESDMAFDEQSKEVLSAGSLVDT